MIGDIVRSFVSPKCPKCGGSLTVSDHLQKESRNKYRLVKMKQCQQCGWQHGYIRRYCEEDY